MWHRERRSAWHLSERLFCFRARCGFMPPSALSGVCCIELVIRSRIRPPTQAAVVGKAPFFNTTSLWQDSFSGDASRDPLRTINTGASAPACRRPWRERWRRRRRRIQGPGLPRLTPGRGRPPRHDRKSGSAPPRVAALKLRSSCAQAALKLRSSCAQAALKLRSSCARAALELQLELQVEASGGPLCPLTPIGVRTGGFRSKREASSPSRYVSQQVLLAGQLAGYIDLPGAALQRHHNSLALELTSVLSQPNQPPEAHLT